jgi:recombination protein RecR
MHYPYIIEKLMKHLQRLPGVGRRTAERYAFDLLLNWSQNELSEFQKILLDLKATIGQCATCGCITDQRGCMICDDLMRKQEQLCIVSSAREVFSIESTQEFRGLYHVLGGLLSPLDGRGEEALGLQALRNRLKSSTIKEVILALDSTVEGDATSLFLKEELKVFDVTVSRLAFGIPVGSSLEYVDGGTLARALSGRNSW